jgi:multidrug transporter EmrE-like cation transporter
MEKIILVSLNILFAVIAQVLIKYSSFENTGQKKWFLFIFLSIFSYASAFVMQSIALKFFPLSKYSASTAIIITLLVFSSGIFLFNETAHLKQYLGLALGIISIYLIIT